MDTFDTIAQRSAATLREEAARHADTEAALVLLHASDSTVVVPLASARHRQSSRTATRTTIAVVVAGLAIALVFVTNAYRAPSFHSGPSVPLASRTPANGSGLDSPTDLPTSTTIDVTRATATSLAMPGLNLASSSFTDPANGWALADPSGHRNGTAQLARTTDGGLTWIAAPLPSLAWSSEYDGAVDGIHFADARNGWLFGAQLWATHDAGTTWIRLDVAFTTSQHRQRFAAIASESGVVYIVRQLEDENITVYSSSVAVDDFASVGMLSTANAGPLEAQVTLSGSTGWLLLNNGAGVVHGMRLLAGLWESWTPPCESVPAIVAAKDMAVTILCLFDPDPASGRRLYQSMDSGASFEEITPAIFSELVGDFVVMASSQRLVIYGTIPTAQGDVPAVLVSSDGGRTWNRSPLPTAAGAWVALTFFDEEHAIGQLGNAIAHTNDGGRTWETFEPRAK